MSDEKRSVVVMDTVGPSATIFAKCGVASDLCRQIATHAVATCGFSPDNQYAFNFTTDPTSGNVTIVAGVNANNVTVVSSSQTQSQDYNAVTVDAQLVNSICTTLFEAKTVSADSVWQKLYDYLSGAAQSINPLPVETEELFITSDRAALRSDWLSVQSDISVICDAALRARNALESRFHGRKESRGESDRARSRQHAEAS